MNRHELVTLLEAFGASGIATAIAGILTARLSGGKQGKAEPNGARTRLQDEVNWLRQQVAALQMRKALEDKNSDVD